MCVGRIVYRVVSGLNVTRSAPPLFGLGAVGTAPLEGVVAFVDHGILTR